MKTLTHKQELYRVYLASPVWKAKRLEALNHYGCVCSRCGEYGNDVHHRTYHRAGGNELMADLEVICRECHEAHHRVERAMNSRRRPRRRNPFINRIALARYLTPTQREILQKQFNLFWGQIYAGITTGERKDVIKVALKMLGKKYCVAPRDPTKPASRLSNEFTQDARKHNSRLLA